MFAKLLVANRGEIACRIIRTARRMGIRTVAVYSDADADALHVRMADEAVAIGPPPARDSYLNIAALLEACRASGAQAVHPGYGFLSESADFARVLGDNGLVFVGPNPKAIAAMGDKIASKALARNAGVAIIPGYIGVVEDAAQARAVAADIGYPVMIKASAGGGGKGMRLARNDEELIQGLQSARSEARSSFADDRLLIEKYIERPRHIEIQVLGDRFGNIIHLGERECSIQRRHQKIIEEAPSPALDEDLRAEMGAQAVSLARKVGYDSAGTVEFVLGRDRRFYFLEMNTRLQVEHPVTELVTGCDLVEWMIRIAAGERLTLAQQDVRLQGAAIEARLYAEDPERNFLPSIGRITRYVEPAGLRIDSGVYEGAAVSLYYDPMLAKLIALGKSREEAARALAEGLGRMELEGVGHNADFLQSVLLEKDFLAGALSTDFLAEHYAEGFHGRMLSEEECRHAFALLALAHHLLAHRLPGFGDKEQGEWVILTGADQRAAHVSRVGEAWHVALKCAEAKEVTLMLDWRFHERIITARIDGTPRLARFYRNGQEYDLHYQGARISARVLTPRAAELMRFMPKPRPAAALSALLAPMPGMIKEILVEAGDQVKTGQDLCVIEAMKMENVLRAEFDGTVGQVKVAAGQSVAADDILLEFA
ncbi:MAG TPA: acetyl/propionyl/methylcrotonyl-CoA carboxylase subunit alpha [Dongiaceae bacterium]|jgi:propionyl-CoA carboxylase alpha chain|nr:acetyl/propionyl/methylcrotonyl-CoA carboxylase subunit alpha [Dongiaceae bacterium]